MKKYIWVVLDEDDNPIHCASYDAACHEHINDAIMAEIDGAGQWKVRRFELSVEIPDDGKCKSCVDDKCVTGRNCVTLNRDAFACGYCKDTGYLPDGNHCQWCAEKPE